MSSPYIKQLLSGLGMSEKDMSELIAKDPVRITRDLTSLYSSLQNDSTKLNIIFVLARIGDVDLTSDFYSNVLETGNAWQKFSVAAQIEICELHVHRRLREALDNYLQGLTPVEAFIREFPNGFLCPIK